MTRQRYVSRVTRAGEAAPSEGFALDARKSALFCRLVGLCRFTERSGWASARDRPDSVAGSAVARGISAAAHVRLVGGCALDPARHQKYDGSTMRLYSLQPHCSQPYRSLTDAATEACPGQDQGLRTEQPTPRGPGVSARVGARRRTVFRGTVFRGTVLRGSRPAVRSLRYGSLVNEPLRAETLGEQSLGGRGRPKVQAGAARSSKRSVRCHLRCRAGGDSRCNSQHSLRCNSQHNLQCNSQWHPVPTRRARHGLNGPHLMASALGSRTKA